MLSAARESAGRQWRSPRSISFVLLAIMLLGGITACGRPSGSPASAQGARPVASPRSLKLPVLLSLHPDRIVLGHTFNEQPDGQSAIAVRAQNVSNASSIVFNGTVLKTVIAPDDILTALVPPDLVRSAGQLQVWITDGGFNSNALPFTIEPG